MMEPLVNKDEHTFILRNVSVLDSGNYSCVYSFNKYSIRNVRASDYNSVQVQVTDDAPDFQPADIFGNTTVKAGEDIQLKCSMFGKRKSGDIHIYLCKNGVGIMMEPLHNRYQYTFILRNASVLDSGNYSCVSSFCKHPPKDVAASEHNSIQVQVTGIQLIKSAVLRSGRTIVKKGEDIELTCSISAPDKPQILHVFLCKDGLGKIYKSLYNQPYSHFSIKNVNLEDSGVYSCMYSSEKYDVSEVNDTERENSILIKVYGE
ncbi:hypothetical protein AOLI_G00093870 [Acnodon oligacanthus]